MKDYGEPNLTAPFDMNFTVALNMEILDEKMFPEYGSEGASGLDLRAREAVYLKPGETRKVGTGVKVEVPKDFSLFIFPRSSSKFRMTNTVGLIDPDYRGEVFVKMTNPTSDYIVIEAGDRIVQAVLIETPKIHINQVASLSETERGEGGFGSTGDK